MPASMKSRVVSAVIGLCVAAGALANPGRQDAPGSGPLLGELRAALESGELEKAVRAGEKAVAADPRNSEANDLLGRAYGLTAQNSQLLEQVRLAKKARECFARAVELDASNAAALSDLARYDMRAPALLGGGKKKARAAAERVLALDPARGHVLLGELAERQKDPPQAEAQFRLAMAVDAGSQRGRKALSDFLAARRRYPEARALWVSAPGTDLPVALAGYELAGIALDSGEGLPAALEDLESALMQAVPGESPTRAELHERLARVYERLGHRAEAAGELQTALALAPGRADWRKALARLEK
jgi:tetratricopeptide (TPR) repeat protein